MLYSKGVSSELDRLYNGKKASIQYLVQLRQWRPLRGDVLGFTVPRDRIKAVNIDRFMHSYNFVAKVMKTSGT